METKTENKPILEQMLNGGYTRIIISENPSDPQAKWGPLHVGINEYQDKIPRGQEVIVSDLLLHTMFEAARTRLEIMVRPIRPYTAQQAHEERLLGAVPVYPAKGAPSLAAPKEGKK